MRSESYDLTEFIGNVVASVKRHELEAGVYVRYDKINGERDTVPNPYGCADAANILYTIGQFPGGPVDRQFWIDRLQAFQSPEDGLFHENTHHPFHTTAHCIAALELFEVKPLLPLTAMEEYLDEPALFDFLDKLNWCNSPWDASHKGAGLFAALHIIGRSTPEWEDAYFAWLLRETDEKTGYIRKGAVGKVPCGEIQTVFPHLAGTFHYLFNFQAARVAHAYPEEMIDTTLRLWEENDFPYLGKNVSFAEIDWIYCLTRSSRLTAHRFDDVRKALRDFGDMYLPYVMELGKAGFNDLHSVFGMLCALAELQQTLPGLTRTPRPLKLALDRRPFI